jgi:hypothetical protein
MIFSSTFHRVFCNFWQGVSFKIFGSRFTLLQQQLQDTHLTNKFLGVSGFHRRSPFPPPASAPPRVAHTLQRALYSHWRVNAMFSLLAFHLDYHWYFWASSTNPAVERPPLGGACSSCAVMEGSHPAFLWTSAVYFIIFVLLFPSPHVHPSYGCDWVLVTQYTFLITFIGDPGFVASVPRVIEPASSKVLPPRKIVFGLPCLYCVFSFLM